MKLTSPRKVAAVASVAALAAAGATVLAVGPASAGNAPRLTVSTATLQAAAGTCTVVTVTPVDQFGVTSQLPDTVTVTLAESPSSASQDLDFCTTGADTPDVAPSYVDGQRGTIPPSGGATQTYTPGPGVTGNGATGGGQPDSSNNAVQSTSDPTALSPDKSYAGSNPAGVDRARYAYQPATGGVRVGVVGLTPGTGQLRAFFDDGTGNTGKDANDYTPQSEETQAPVVTFNVTAGGQPASAEAAAAVASIDVQPTEGVATPGTAQNFTATLRNGSGDTVRGVTPLVQVAANGANASAIPRCDESDNAGVSRCSFTGVNPGTDVLTVYVNRAGGTAGIDSGEITKQVTRTTTKTPVSASQARYIDVTPKGGTFTSGQSATFTANISDVNGAPADGVSVVFSKSGPGSFAAGTTTVTRTTDPTGRASVRIDTPAGDSGPGTVTATIGTAGTQCTQQQGAGAGSTSGTPAGRCDDQATYTIAAAPSPGPSASATGTASISPSPSAIPTPPSPSPSASSIAPSPINSTNSPVARQRLTLSTSTTDIQPNQEGLLSATGTEGVNVTLRCYSRPSDTYFDARPDISNANGTVVFRITPGTNTRCFVKYADNADSDSTSSESVVINVHTTLSLSTVRTAAQTYTFQGRNLPRRTGQLITLYRVDNNGKEVRTSNLKTDASGIYRVSRHFTGKGTFKFRVRTSQTFTNAPGVSNTITVNVR